jgi:hypothetical protein
MTNEETRLKMHTKSQSNNPKCERSLILKPHEKRVNEQNVEAYIWKEIEQKTEPRQEGKY